MCSLRSETTDEEALGLETGAIGRFVLLKLRSLRSETTDEEALGLETGAIGVAGRPRAFCAPRLGLIRRRGVIFSKNDKR